MPNNNKEKPEDNKPTKRDEEEEELAMSFQKKLSMSKNQEKSEKKVKTK